MVAPSWGQFQKPSDFSQQQSMDQEYQQEVPGQIQDQTAPSSQKPQWGQFQTPMTYQQAEPDESGLDWLMRNITANTSRVAEQFGGAYGNVEKFGKDVLSNFPQSAGLVGWAISELVGPEKWERMVRGPIKDQTLLPTSSQLKEGMKTLTKGFTEPKTKGEKKFQAGIEDIAATFAGGRMGGRSTRQMLFNHLLTPVASNVVKEGVEHLGFGEDKGNIAKAATWLSLSLLGNVNAPQHASELMNEGRQGIPSNVHIDVPRMQQRLQTLRNDPHLLHSDPRTALARQEIEAIERDLANGQTSVNSMMTAYDGINAAKRNRDLFALDRNDRNFARGAIDRVRNEVRDEIMASGNAYPQALNSWSNGVQAWASIHQSRAITNWVNDLVHGPYAKVLGGPALALFGVGSLGAAKTPLLALPLTATAGVGYKAYQVGHRVFNSPTLSNYYWRAISAAQQENAKVFISNYEKLNAELKKKESIDGKPKSQK